MRKAVAYFRANPIIAGALAILIVALVFFVATSPRGPQTSTVAPQAAATPPPQASPAAPSPQMSPARPTPGMQATPAARAPAPAPSPPTSQRIAAPGDAGRPDPFAPLVRPGTGGPPSGAPVPPPAPLPPPLFPGQQQPTPQPAAPPPPPPKEASGAALVGLVGDTGQVAIIRLGRETFIVSPGDVIMNKIKVTVIDVNKSIVILEQEGERFELRMGGVSGRNVAA